MSEVPIRTLTFRTHITACESAMDDHGILIRTTKVSLLGIGSADGVFVDGERTPSGEISIDMQMTGIDEDLLALASTASPDHPEIVVTVTLPSRAKLVDHLKSQIENASPEMLKRIHDLVGGNAE